MEIKITDVMEMDPLPLRMDKVGRLIVKGPGDPVLKGVIFCDDFTLNYIHELENKVKELEKCQSRSSTP